MEGIIWVSIILQASAAVLALRLIPASGRAIAWILLCVAFLLMAARRLIALLAEYQVIHFSLKHLSAELVALSISVLIVLGVLGIKRIFDERNRQADALQRLAHLDPLTGLPNRHSLALHVSALAARPNVAPFSLLVVDLDRFREFNDTLGHSTGDAILKEIAHRFQSLKFPGISLVARMSGDEFAVVLENPIPSEVLRCARQFSVMLDEPFHLEGTPFFVHGSIGIASFPPHGRDADTLIRHAESAMYSGKRELSAVALYDEAKDKYNVERLALASELRFAIERRQLELHFQPVLDAGNLRVASAECLLRWQHPERGLVMPDLFIELAEQTGLIRQLTVYCLNAALEQISQWQSSGIPLRLAVNISPLTLQDDDLPDLIKFRARELNVDLRRLMLEITESAIMADEIRSHKVIERFHGLGLPIIVDDFGTGYSSLSLLSHLPISVLKIDKSFVLHMETNERDAVLVRSMVDLAHNLGLKVTAEGVETQSLRDLLQMLGTDYLQGFLFAPALDGAQLVEWLHHQEGGPETASGKLIALTPPARAFA